ncbi:MAG: hypothetical protein ACOX7P_06390, partial [Oscillospiraceae bacterium]
TNPYGTDEDKTAFESYGVVVTYNADEQTWTIDFGETVTRQIVKRGGITFYLVLVDADGNTWGSMYDVTDENTFAYTVTREPEPIPENKLDFGVSSAVYDYDGALASDGEVSFSFDDISKFKALYEDGLGYDDKEFTHTDESGQATADTSTWAYALVPFDVLEGIGTVESVTVYSDAARTNPIGEVTYLDLTESHDVYRISAIRIAHKDSGQWKYLGSRSVYVLIELNDGKQYTVKVSVSVSNAETGDVLFDPTP